MQHDCLLTESAIDGKYMTGEDQQHKAGCKAHLKDLDGWLMDCTDDCSASVDGIPDLHRQTIASQSE